ncbi:ATP-binding protein [Candidatus Contendibacter odensensis]
MTRSRHAPPKASAMLEALRGLGYSTATALADVIDNSIAARAATVHLHFVWAESASAIHILDDGVGMDASGLDRAMRLGERNPLDTRAADDLGRFGLGLKTASLSQCRRLTVASRRGGQTHCLRWDLDEIARRSDDGWYLLEEAAEGSVEYLRILDEQPQGTLVLWEILDRIITQGFSEQNFLDLMDRVEQHLSMVFHRYLEGSRPRLRILINDRPIRPWDPFLIDHPATWSSPVQRYRSAAALIEVQGHVLPHLIGWSQELTNQPAGRKAGPCNRASTSTAMPGCWSQAAGWDWARDAVGHARKPIGWRGSALTSPTALMPTGKLTFASRQPARRSRCVNSCLILPRIFASGRDGSLPTGGG